MWGFARSSGLLGLGRVYIDTGMADRRDTFLYCTNASSRIERKPFWRLDATRILTVPTVSSDVIWSTRTVSWLANSWLMAVSCWNKDEGSPASELHDDPRRAGGVDELSLERE